MADTMPSTNFFTTAAEGFVATLNGSILSGATTVPLSTVAGLTNGKIFAGIIEPSLTKQQVFTGVVDTSGVQITNVVWVRGSNADHAAGVTIVDYVTGASHNMMTTGILKQHTQAGAHTGITTDTLAATGNISTTTGTINAATVSSLQDTGTALSTYRKESQTPFVASGGVWTGDAYASTLNGSMTALVCYINGRRISIGAVTAHAFTASKDTYIDVLDNADGTGTLVYTAATNNAASPALAANSLRIAIVVTGAGNIAAATSINQGSPAAIGPTVSSNILTVQDSLGNLIYPTDPTSRLLGYRQITSGTMGATAAVTAWTGLSCPVIIPAGRRVRLKIYGNVTSGTTSAGMEIGICKTSASAANALTSNLTRTITGTVPQGLYAEGLDPSTGAVTYLGYWKSVDSATLSALTNEAGILWVAWIQVEVA